VSTDFDTGVISNENARVTAEAALYGTSEAYQQQLAGTRCNTAGVVPAGDTVYIPLGNVLYCCELCMSLPGGGVQYCCDACASIPGTSGGTIFLSR
jgi:hypothetical protein